jgi:hypothetical protein
MAKPGIESVKAWRVMRNPLRSTTNRRKTASRSMIQFAVPRVSHNPPGIEQHAPLGVLGGLMV